MNTTIEQKRIKKHQEVVLRNETRCKILEMVTQGYSLSDIAKELKIECKMVINNVKILKLAKLI